MPTCRIVAVNMGRRKEDRGGPQRNAPSVEINNWHCKSAAWLDLRETGGELTLTLGRNSPLSSRWKPRKLKQKLNSSSSVGAEPKWCPKHRYLDDPASCNVATTACSAAQLIRLSASSASIMSASERSTASACSCSEPVSRLKRSMNFSRINDGARATTSAPLSVSRA
jgi:hypothetical protein